MQTILLALVCSHLLLVTGFMVHTMIRLTKRRNASNGDGGLAVEAVPAGPPPPAPSYGIVLGSPETRGTLTVENILAAKLTA